MAFEPGNLIDEQFSEKEMKVLWTFIDNGGRVASYNKVFGKNHKSPSAIYTWFRTPHVQLKLRELGDSLAVYDTVCDKILLNIVMDPNASNRDKITAIKTWNDLRDRVHTTIKVESMTKLDLKDVSTDNLESIVLALTEQKNDKPTESTD
jgi:hypothetical protein